jgi:hypothetical protein
MDGLQRRSETFGLLATEYVEEMSRTYLGIMSVHSVGLEVLFRNISFEMEDK